jgi:hypothetical protein
MFQALKSASMLLATLAILSPVLAQETPVADDQSSAAIDSQPLPAAEDTDQPAPAAESPPARAADDPFRRVEGVVEKVDQSEQAQEVKTSILAPIYSLAEKFSFPAFHWLAFAAMVTGAVSFALQLVLGKLVVLSKFSMSPSEILSDALGLTVSLIGLVLTTQAATENSSFTTSASAVISAATVGGLLGLVFYVWGQRQELQAVEGRRRAAATKTTTVDKPGS